MAQDLMQGLKAFQRQFPKEAQMAKVEIQRAIAEGGAPDPEEIKEILEIAQDLQKSPARWAELRQGLVEAGMPDADLPPPNASKVQIAQMVGILLLTVFLVGEGPDAAAAPMTPPQGLINAGV